MAKKDEVIEIPQEFVSEIISFPSFGVSFKTTPDDPRCEKQLEAYLQGVK